MYDDSIFSAQRGSSMWRWWFCIFVVACKTPSSQLSGEPDGHGFVNYRSDYDRNDWLGEPGLLQKVDQWTQEPKDGWQSITDDLYPFKDGRLPLLQTCYAKLTIDIPEQRSATVEWELDTQGAPRLSRMLALLLRRQFFSKKSKTKEVQEADGAAVIHDRANNLALRIQANPSFHGPSENLTRVNLAESKICQVPLRDGDVGLYQELDSPALHHIFFYIDSKNTEASKPVGTRIGRITQGSRGELLRIEKSCNYGECKIAFSDISCQARQQQPLKLSSIQNFQPISSECL